MRLGSSSLNDPLLGVNDYAELCDLGNEERRDGSAEAWTDNLMKKCSDDDEMRKVELKV
jgi:hypothetical protein